MIYIFDEHQIYKNILHFEHSLKSLENYHSGYGWPGG